MNREPTTPSALKGNQGNIYEDVRQLFEFTAQQEEKDLPEQFHSTREKGHGGIEIRRYRVMGNSEYLLGAEKWSGLRSVGMVELERRVKGQIQSIEQRYYLLSFECDVRDIVQKIWLLFATWE